MPSTKISTKKHIVWTELDSWGLPFGVRRLPMESNRDFKARLLAVMKSHGDASLQGLTDGLSALFNLTPYNVGEKTHFYLRMTPVEYNDSGTVLDVSVTIDGISQTQNIEYYEPKDWMSGGRANYVFATGAEGFILWRDSDGKYTNHLEFLTAPPTGSSITVTYWAQLEDLSYVQVVETSDENPDLVPIAHTEPTNRQIQIQQLFDADFLAEHTLATGVPDATLKSIIADINSNYPFQWGQFIWDEYQWNIDVNQGLLPSYYDGTTQSGDFQSGTGIGDDLQVTDLDSVGQPKIRPGYLYYAGREFYLYKLMSQQEEDIGVTTIPIVDESGNYARVSRPAPIVVRTDFPTAFIVAPLGSPVRGKHQRFDWNAAEPFKSVFVLTVGVPSDPNYITIHRIIITENNTMEAIREYGFAYTASANSISLATPLNEGEYINVDWSDSYSRHITIDPSEMVTGPNMIRTYEDSYRILMDDLLTEQTLNSSLVIVTYGAHKHYAKITNPFLKNGVLEDTTIGESGNVAALLGVTTAFQEGSDGYMVLPGKDHTHQITDGAVQPADIILNDDTVFTHTHSITIPNDFGLVEPTIGILPHKPDPKAVELSSPAAQTFLTTIWDGLELDSNTYPYGSFTAHSASGGLHLDIFNSDNPHTIFYERGDYAPDPDDDIVVLQPHECPSLYQARGKILAVGQNLPAFFLNIYPETTVFSSWGKQLGITIEALDTEGRGLVKGCTITIAANDDYTTVGLDVDNTATNAYGTIYLRPTIAAGSSAITNGEAASFIVTGTFVTKDKYTKPIPSNVSEIEEGPVGDKTYTYTVTETFTLTWIGN